MSEQGPTADRSQVLTTGDVESRFISVEGVRVHYLFRDGTGPTVVFVPGGMVDSPSLSWKPVLENIPAGWRMYSPEAPGYGASGAPPAQPYTTEFYLSFLHHFLDELGLSDVYLAGSSLGGAIVLGTALTLPGRVRGLILMGAYGVQDRVHLQEAAWALCHVPEIENLARWALRRFPPLFRAALPVAVHHPECITEELVRDCYRGVNDSRALEAFIRWMRSDLLHHRTRTNFTRELHRLRMPVLMLHGRYDFMLPVRFAERAAKLIARAELHLFSSGHLVAREQPSGVLEAVSRFVDRVEAEVAAANVT